MTAGAALQEITSRIAMRFSPISIVLFGSHASGTSSPDSDLDLLVVVKDGSERRKQTVAMYESLRGIPFPADLLVVTPSDIASRANEPGGVIRSALEEGIVVFEQGQSVA